MRVHRTRNLTELLQTEKPRDEKRQHWRQEPWTENTLAGTLRISLPSLGLVCRFKKDQDKQFLASELHTIPWPITHIYRELKYNGNILCTIKVVTSASSSDRLTKTTPNKAPTYRAWSFFHGGKHFFFNLRRESNRRDSSTHQWCKLLCDIRGLQCYSNFV